jgi:hypothetical protein
VYSRFGRAGVIDVVVALQHPLALAGHVPKKVEMAVGHERAPPSPSGGLTTAGGWGMSREEWR